jgi:signal transduction histidine kinase
MTGEILKSLAQAPKSPHLSSPASNLSFVRASLLALAAGGFILLAIISSSLYLVYQTQHYVAGAVEARRVRSSASDLLSTVQDAESGQRGFLLMMDPSFLKPYEDSIGDIEQRQAVLAAAIKGSVYFNTDINALGTALARKIAELRQTIELAQTGNRAAALDIVRNEVGLKLMTEIRNTLKNLISNADTKIAEQVETQLDLAAILRFITVCGAIAIVSLLIGITIIIRRYVRELLAARNDMEELNGGLEQRVKERTEDLMQANQEIQRYAYIVTHDLRAPLVNIMGFTSELANALKVIRAYFSEEGPRDADAKAQALQAVEEDLPEAIGFIRSSTRKMDGLINAILKISRDGRRPLKPETVDLDRLIQEAGETIQHQLGETGGALSVSVKIDKFVSDQFSMEQVIGNLLDNAVKYRDPKRPLNLAVRAYSINRFRVGIDITDNGRGIAAEDHERIFELFRRAGTQDSPGEGIGLAHVRSLVRNMGGDIHVNSELGKGTTFMIRLPSDLSQFVGSIGQ